MVYRMSDRLLIKWFAAAQEWRCIGRAVVGVGSSPQGAYDDWAAAIAVSIGPQPPTTEAA